MSEVDSNKQLHSEFVRNSLKNNFSGHELFIRICKSHFAKIEILLEGINGVREEPSDTSKGS